MFKPIKRPTLRFYSEFTGERGSLYARVYFTHKARKSFTTTITLTREQAARLIPDGHIRNLTPEDAELTAAMEQYRRAAYAILDSYATPEQLHAENTKLLGWEIVKHYLRNSANATK